MSTNDVDERNAAPRVKPIAKRPRDLGLLVALLGIDAVFVLLHVVYKLIDLLIPSYEGILLDERFNLLLDRSFGEQFGYLEEATVALLLATLFARTRRPTFLAWTVVFAAIVADDSLMLHETSGGWLADTLALPARFGLRAQDFGELLFVAMMATPLLLIVALAWWYADPEGRRLGRDLGLIVAALAIFAVVLDMVDRILPWQDLWEAAALLEDGGEMVVVSVACWYVVRLFLDHMHDRSTTHV